MEKIEQVQEGRFHMHFLLSQEKILCKRGKKIIPKTFAHFSLNWDKRGGGPATWSCLNETEYEQMLLCTHP